VKNPRQAPSARPGQLCPAVDPAPHEPRHINKI
jgi:hypothetical protein